jgi:hypothetical protein
MSGIRTVARLKISESTGKGWRSSSGPAHDRATTSACQSAKPRTITGGPACVRLASGRELVGVPRAFGMVHGAILRTSPRQSSTFTAPTESR